MGFIPSLRDKYAPIPAFINTCFSAASYTFPFLPVHYPNTSSLFGTP